MPLVAIARLCFSVPGHAAQTHVVFEDGREGLKVLTIRDVKERLWSRESLQVRISGLGLGSLVLGCDARAQVYAITQDRHPLEDWLQQLPGVTQALGVGTLPRADAPVEVALAH